MWGVDHVLVDVGTGSTDGVAGTGAVLTAAKHGNGH